MQTNLVYTRELIKIRRIVVSNTSKNLSYKFQTFIEGGLLIIELLVCFNIQQIIESQYSKLKYIFKYYRAARLEVGKVILQEITLQILALKELYRDQFYKASKNFKDIIYSTQTIQQRYQVTSYNRGLYFSEVNQLDLDKPINYLRQQIIDLRDFVAQGSSVLQGYNQFFATLERDKLIAQIIDKLIQEHISNIIVINEIRTLTYQS